jgi:hypothetical protein
MSAGPAAGHVIMVLMSEQQQCQHYDSYLQLEGRRTGDISSGRMKRLADIVLIRCSCRIT